MRAYHLISENQLSSSFRLIVTVDMLNKNEEMDRKMCANRLFHISFIFGTFWEVSIMTNNEAGSEQIGVPMRKHLGNVA